jgi:hypothetical protein
MGLDFETWQISPPPQPSCQKRKTRAKFALKKAHIWPFCKLFRGFLAEFCCFSVCSQASPLAKGLPFLQFRALQAN